MLKLTQRLMAVLSLSFFFIAASSQPLSEIPANDKPYQLSASGKQVTIRSVKGIKQVMVWSTNGNRIVEHRTINNNSYSFTVPQQHKMCFIMVGLQDGKVYTQKLGLP